MECYFVSVGRCKECKLDDDGKKRSFLPGNCGGLVWIVGGTVEIQRHIRIHRFTRSLKSRSPCCCGSVDKPAGSDCRTRWELSLHLVQMPRLRCVERAQGRAQAIDSHHDECEPARQFSNLYAPLRHVKVHR